MSFTHCPRCNARQNFAQQIEPVRGELLRVYLECDKCHWTYNIKYTTKEKEKILKSIAKLNKKIGKYGQHPPQSLVKLLDRKLKQYDRA